MSFLRLAMLTLLCAGSLAPAIGHATDPVTTADLRLAVGRLFDRVPPKAVRILFDLGGNVAVEPSDFSVEEGTVRVSSARLRRLDLEDEQKMVARLGELLDQVVAELATRRSDLTAEDRQKLMSRAAISLRPRVKAAQVPKVPQVRAAIMGYLAWVARNKAWSERGIDYLRNAELKEEHFSVTVNPGSVSVDFSCHLLEPERFLHHYPALGNIRQAVRSGNVNAAMAMFDRVQRGRVAAGRPFLPALSRLVEDALRRFPAGGSLGLVQGTEITISPSIGVSDPPSVEAAATPRGFATGPGATGAPPAQPRVAALGGSRSLERAKPKEMKAPVAVRTAVESAEKPARTCYFNSGGFEGGAVSALAISPAKDWLAVAGDVIRLYHLPSGTLRHTIYAEHGSSASGAFTDVEFNPDGNRLLATVAGTKHSLRVYNLADLSEIEEIYSAPRGHFTRIVLGPDNRQLVTTTSAGQLLVWDWPTRKIQKAFQLPGAIEGVGFSEPDELVVLSRPDVGQSVYITRMNTGGYETEKEPLLRGIAALCRDDRGNAIAEFHPATFDCYKDGSVLLGGITFQGGSSYSHWATILAPAASGYESKIIPFGYNVAATAFSRDGLWLAAADTTGQIRVLDVATQKELKTFRGEAVTALSVGFGDSPMALRWGDANNRFQGAEWQRNHYAPLQRELDFAGRSLQLISAPPPAANDKLGEYSLSVDVARKLLSVRKGNGPAKVVDVHDYQHWDVLTCSLLETKHAEQPTGVIVGMENGVLTLLDAETVRPQRHFIGHQGRVWCASASTGEAAGRFLISGGADGIVRVWSLENFRERYNVPALLDDTNQVTFPYPGSPLHLGDRVESIGGLPLRQWLYSERAQARPTGPEKVQILRGGVPQTLDVALVNMGDLAEPLLQVWANKQGTEWLAWTKSGYYAGTHESETRLGWIENRGARAAARFVSAAQARDIAYRPEIVRLTLELGSEEEAVERANSLVPPGPQPTATVASLPQPPRVRFVSPREGTSHRTPDDSIEVTVGVTAFGPVPPEVEFVVNDTLVATKGINVVPANGAGAGELLVKEKLPLNYGINRIRAVARQGSVSTTSGQIVVERRDERPRELPRLVYFGIGISEYGPQKPGMQPIPNLRFADQDVDHFGAALHRRWLNQAPQDRLYSQFIALILTDRQATQAGIAEAFDRLFKLVKPGDTVIVHLSGHGAIQGKEFLLLPHGADLAKPAATCWSWIAFVGQFRRLENARILLLVDACHSAGICPGDGAGEAIFHSGFPGLTLAACGAGQLARENANWKHGAFTLALLEAVEGKCLFSSVPWGKLDPDSNGDGKVSFHELTSFAIDRVRQLTTTQTPDHTKAAMGLNEPPLF